MKRILRIIIGLSISPIMLIIGTFFWIFSNENWTDTIGRYIWYLIIGDWDKLPE
jgi:nitrogen fixation-related uncharacterized protein